MCFIFSFRTYPSAAALAEAARVVPEGRLLVETDAPYLTPQAVRKQRNQPAFVALTVAFLAELRSGVVKLFAKASVRSRT